ncbi:MAG: hypothetical protein IJJ84_12290, partial [Kiritimatiellae bacterium]|nr:hypothetical protein [Kiritimatiellia bacterium]
MSKANPRKAMAALLPLAVECPCGCTVRPMTLGMWAALERVGSPLVTGKEAKDTLELVPSLYLLTHDPREVLRGSFYDDAVARADTLPVSALEEIQRACYRQMGAMFDVIPEVKKNSRPETDGSRPSSTGPRVSTAGGLMKSSGRSPAPQSR